MMALMLSIIGRRPISAARDHPALAAIDPWG